MAEDKLTKGEIIDLCQHVLGRAPDGISYPGGQGRKTVLVSVDGKEYAVSKRASVGRAELEARVLETYSSLGTVPGIVAHKGAFVVQEGVAGKRLTLALEMALGEERESLVRISGSSLLKMQVFSNGSEMALQAPEIGARAGWFQDFAETPNRLANFLGMKCDGYDAARVVPLLHSETRVLVKWDARPGNALLTEDGEIVWFDWEHCGIGAPEDDLVWFLADEWTPICHSVEAGLLDQIETPDRKSLNARFHAKVVLHSCIRLGLIFQRKGDGPWWSAQAALASDRVGVSPAHVRRVCRKAAYWAAQDENLTHLCAFFQSVEAETL